MYGMTRTQQVVALLLIWAAALVLVDRIFDKHIQQANGIDAGKPQVTVVVEHLCCSGCVDATLKALEGVPWLGKPKLITTAVPTPDQNDQAGAAAQKSTYTGAMLSDIKAVNIEEADFAQLDRAQRDSGLVPTQIRVSGIPHFALVAHLPHMCCSICVDALNAAFIPKGVAPSRVLPGMELASVNKNSQTVTVQFRKVGDVELFIRKLEATGFQADNIHVVLLDNR